MITEYGKGYRAGREDAVTAVSIFLALNGFHPDDKKWVERFTDSILGRHAVLGERIRNLGNAR